jgi:uncharacterized protein (TIGR02145 family)
MNSKPLLLATGFLIITNSLAAQVTDKDGNRYNTVKVGTQEWMAENLNVSHFRNGDEIPEIEDSTAWHQASISAKPAWCYYNRDPSNGRKYGKLYNWYAVNDPRGLAPYGWHIPTDAEWTVLTTYLGGTDVAGTKMKFTNGWSNNGYRTNESGFAGLPGGHCDDDNDGFYAIGENGSWWSSSESGTGYVWYRDLYLRGGGINRYQDGKGIGFSVRCLK